MNTTQLKAAGGDGLDRVSEKAQNLVESKDQVVRDFKALLTEGEALFKSATSGGDVALAAARDRFKEQLATAKAKYAELEEVTVKQAKRAAAVTDDYVHGNPWTSMAVAGGIGLLIGVLITTRRD
ncbi:MAG: DUF883 domain-containing protein [Betaproteobacteria bacterium]